MAGILLSVPWFRVLEASKMTPVEAVTLGQNAITITLLLSTPLLVIGMVVGLLIAVFQATTQIQEMTLTFVPKIFAVMLALLSFLPGC